MVDRHPRWDAGTAPWARRSLEASETVPCYFCGGQTAVVSFGDVSDDKGRLELYCENQLCDAREVVVLVGRDGADAFLRADVRALRAIDQGSERHASPPYDLLKQNESRKQRAPRRQDTQPFTLDVS